MLFFTMVDVGCRFLYCRCPPTSQLYLPCLFEVPSLPWRPLLALQDVMRNFQAGSCCSAFWGSRQSRQSDTGPSAAHHRWLRRTPHEARPGRHCCLGRSCLACGSHELAPLGHIQVMRGAAPEQKEERHTYTYKLAQQP